MGTDYTVTLTEDIGILERFMVSKPYTAPVYCTVNEVAEFLQVTLPEAGTGDYGWGYVERTIRRKEALIDNVTFRSWRPNYVKDEYHEYNLYGFLLRHRGIRKVISIDIWQNGWLTLIEGRDMGRGQYWVDETLGICYFTGNVWYPWGHMRYRMRRFPQYQGAIKVCYVWGAYMEDDYDNNGQRDEYADMVKDLCLKLVAIELANSNDYTKIFPMGMDSIPMPEKVEMWERQTNEMLEELKEFIAY